MLGAAAANVVLMLSKEFLKLVIAGASILLITLITVSFQAIKAAMANPVKSLRAE